MLVGVRLLSVILIRLRLTRNILFDLILCAHGCIVSQWNEVYLRMNLEKFEKGEIAETHLKWVMA